MNITNKKNKKKRMKKNIEKEKALVASLLFTFGSVKV
jgi:hypothetical protein